MSKILVVAGARADPSSPSIARAAALAERSGAAIVLLGAVYDPHLEGYLGRREVYEPLRERLVAERGERLRTVAAALEARGLRCETMTSWSDPAHSAVLREAAAVDVELVVFEPEDARGLSHDEWRLVSMSPSPVLVVRDASIRPYATVVAAVDPTGGFDKPADLDRRILLLAERLRDLTGARLEVVHCLPSFKSFLADGAGMLDEAEKTLKEQREEELARLVEEAGMPREAATLVEGKPADVLSEKSARGDGTLLVLGTVQRGPIARLLIGSTAERVLRADGGDVAVIQPGLGAGDSEADAADDGATRHVETDPSERA